VSYRFICENKGVNKGVILLHPASNEYVFTYKGRPVKEIKSAFETALKRAEITKYRLHDLRHTFASRLVMNGVDLVTVQELLGHKSIVMTKRYSHPTPEHKKKAVELLSLNNQELSNKASHIS